MTVPPSEKLEADARDLRVSWTANRRNLTAGGIAALVVFGVLAATVWMRPGKTTQVASVSVPPNTETGVSPPVTAPTASDLPSSSPAASTASNKALDREAAMKASPVGKPEPAAKREKIPAQSNGNNNSSSGQSVSPPPANGKSAQSTLNVSPPSGTPATGSTMQPGAPPQANPANQGSTTIASSQPPSSPSAAIGNPLPQPPPSTINATPKAPETLSIPSTSPEKDAIRAALHRYKEAYESESVDELLKIWPSLSRDQRKALKQGFDKAQAVRVELECGEPSIAGASAQVRCAQSMRYTEKGKVLPYQKVSVDIMLRKAAGSWLVDNVQAN